VRFSTETAAFLVLIGLAVGAFGTLIEPQLHRRHCTPASRSQRAQQTIHGLG
jgi:hypothetical protein